MKIAASVLTAAGLAALTALTAPLPAQAQAGVECGGIGEEGRALAESVPHNLRLVYAQPDGDYLGAVATRISRGGEVVAEIRCPGPWVLANLPAGTYEVTASFREQTKTRRVTVSGSGRREQVITF